MKVETFFGGDVNVTVETRHYRDAGDTRCYIFEVGRRGGAYLVSKCGYNRYIKPRDCEEARIY